MDPTQCYLEMYEAMQAGDLHLARERAVALRGWLDQGGFPPSNYSLTEVQAYLASVLRRTTDIVDADGD